MSLSRLAGASALALFAFASAASALPVEMTWTTTITLDELDRNAGVSQGPGEAIAVTLTFDNGGDTLASQVWDVDDFVLYRIEGASGWSAEMGPTGLEADGVVATDAGGMLISMPEIAGSGVFDASWTDEYYGAWFIEGGNYIIGSGSYGMHVADVASNMDPDAWTLSFAGAGAEAPVPAALPLLAGGIAALAGLGRARWKV